MVRDHIDSIHALLDLLAASTATEIEIAEGPVRIRVSKDPRADRPDRMQGVLPSDEGTTTSGLSGAGSTSRPSPEGSKVTAPTYGVFHDASGPGAAPFVRVGEQVHRGQQLGLLEAMKVFSSITAPANGVIEAIHATSGQEVASGQLLFSLGEPT